MKVLGVIWPSSWNNSADYLVSIVSLFPRSVWHNKPPRETCMIVKCGVADVGETRGHAIEVVTSREGLARSWRSMDAGRERTARKEDLAALTRHLCLPD
jgi:hypothetical protein